MIVCREILRLKSMGFSDRNFVYACGVSLNTVKKVKNRVPDLNVSWPLSHDMTDAILGELLFPEVKQDANKRLPDYDYVRKELLRSGVAKTPLN